METLHVVVEDLTSSTPGGGLIPRSKLVARLEAFSRWEWIQLFTASAACDEQAANGRIGQRRRKDGDDVESRVMRAERLVHVGELSSAVHVRPIARQRRPPQPRRATPTRDSGAPTSCPF